MDSHFKVLRSYRNLVRACRLTFNGDIPALTAARERIRGEYTGKAPASRAELLQRLQMAKDVAHILRSNVVQAKRDDRNVFKLGLHKDSELGNNDDRFLPVEQSTDPKGCSGGPSRA